MGSRRNFLRGMARVATPGVARPAERPRPEPPAEPEHAAAGAGRYAAAIAATEWGPARQSRIARSEVLVIGAGSLAGPVLAYLAGAGIGRLGLVDDAAVAEGDLRAGVLHYTPDVGVAKAHSAAVKLGFLNPDIVVEPYQVHLDAGNAEGLLTGQHVMVDCSNSEATRRIAAAACHPLGVALVTAEAGSWGGWVLSVAAGLRACPDCARADGLADGSWLPGPVAGMVGSLMAQEALARVAGTPHGVTAGKLIRVDVSAPELRAVPWHPQADCPHLGDR